VSVEPAQALDISGAIGPLSELIGIADGDPPEEQTTPTEKAPPVEEAPAEPQAETTTEDAPSEEVPADEATAEEGASEEEQPQQPQKYTVKVDGKPVEVTLEEALAGYRREQDYTRKTQALSEERKGFEAERQSVAQERAQYGQLLQALRQQLNQFEPPEPDEKLSESNPLDYMLQRQRRDAWERKQAAANSELNRLAQQQEQERKTGLATAMANSQKWLSDHVTDWKDPVKGDALRAQLRDYAKEIGFTDDEISQTYDHRAVMALLDGMRGRAMAKKQASAAPPRPAQTGPKAAPAGSGVRTPGKSTEIARMKQRLAQSGKVDDAAALFLNSGYVDHT
jgi:hypothetical protein